MFRRSDASGCRTVSSSSALQTKQKVFLLSNLASLELLMIFFVVLELLEIVLTVQVILSAPVETSVAARSV